MALKDEPIEFRREQYDEKNAILSANGEEVSARTLYEDIFSDMDMRMPIVFIDEDEQKHIKKMTLDEALEESEGRNDMLLGGTTYFNEFISKDTAKNIHAFLIDMDNVYAGTLQQAFRDNWARANGEPVPMPTYIVNSGTGLHLYFLLDRPLPHFKRQATQIDQLYRRLAKAETTGRTYLIFSRQWFGQDFRIAGGLGKDGWKNTVFRVGDKWDADKLAAALGLDFPKVKNEETGKMEDFKFEYEGDGKPRPKKKKRRSKQSIFRRTGYTLNHRVYDSALNRCKEETKEGTRYLSMCALAALAWKCKISEEQLRHDLLSLLPYYNKGATRIVKPKEIESAIKMYNPKAMTTPRERSEDWLGWKFHETKRNGRKRWDHLQAKDWYETIKSKDGQEKKRRRANLCKENRERAIQDMIDAGELHGRPVGSGTKEKVVQDWRRTHPTGKKIDCERELHLSRHTVLKWWNG